MAAHTTTNSLLSVSVRRPLQFARRLVPAAIIDESDTLDSYGHAPVPTDTPVMPPGISHRVLKDGKLVEYRLAADTPTMWEELWRQNPGLPMPERRDIRIINRWWRDAIVPALPPTAGPVLEAGCGNGTVMRTFCAAGYDMTGLDFAPRAIQANSAIHPEGNYIVGDVRDLPLPTASLAGYLSFGVVEHFERADRVAILREAARVVRPGGIVVITVPYFSPMRKLAARLGRFDRKPPDSTPIYQRFFTPYTLAAELTEHGLDPVSYDAYDVRKGLEDVRAAKYAWTNFSRTGRPRERWCDHPPSSIRRFAGHMLLMVTRRCSGTAEACAA